MNRNEAWAIKALRRVAEYGGSSTSVGCRVAALGNGEVVLNALFVSLVLSAVSRAEAARPPVYVVRTDQSAICPVFLAVRDGRAILDTFKFTVTAEVARVHLFADLEEAERVAHAWSDVPGVWYVAEWPAGIAADYQQPKQEGFTP